MDNHWGGANFTLIPPSSSLVLDGTVAFSNYDIALAQADDDPRQSSITSYSVNVNFNYFANKSEVKYGFEFNGFNTDFVFKNFLNNTIEQRDFTSELAGFIKYKQKLDKLIIEPGLRMQYYASQSTFSFEPRFGLKFNATDKLRFKLAGGMYSQNLVSSVNELDVVNLFVGFLAGPQETIFKPNSTEPTDHRLQKSIHGIIGAEIDLSKNLYFNVEPYYKLFTQLISLNRNKLSERDPDFSTETGDAYGIDFSLRYETKQLYLWGTYSLGYVNRDDGFQEYPTIFDRRHNINFLGSYNFGQDNSWEASLRWNFGSGFPFTLTKGFYTEYNFEDGLSTDPITENGNLGILYDEQRNGGRLPYYHRLDASLKKKITFTPNMNLEIVASVTNLYNRENIFYFDRVRYDRVNQLPILPSLGLKFTF